MKLITKSPTNSTNNIHESYFNHRIKKNPYVNSELSLDNYEIINKSCNCSCHKHKHHNRFHQHALNNNLSINKFGKLEISQIMDNNKKGIPLPLLIIGMIIALVLGWILGKFAFGIF